MTDTNDIGQIERELERIGDTSGWIHKYRSTHGQLSIIISAPGANRVWLYLQGCSYLCGPTSWGSRLRVSQSGSEITLATEGDAFKAIGSHLWLSSRPPPAPPNLAAGVRVVADVIAALPATPPGAPTPPVVAAALTSLRDITAMLAGADDRTDDIVAQFQELASRYPELRPAADAALAMSIRVLP